MSCLFNSLSAFIHETPYDIRQIVCDYLERDGPIIQGLDTKFVLELENKNYLKDMRKTSTWGGANEIQAACSIWRIRVIVKNYRDRSEKDIEFIPIYGDYVKTVSLYWTGGHYEPIRVQGTYGSPGHPLPL
jgi:hypothetical protein